MRINLSGRYFFPPLEHGEEGERKYLAIRVEGGSQPTTTAGSSDCVVEFYLFYNGWTEIRIGDWNSVAGYSGYLDSSGTGHSFIGGVSSGKSWVFIRDSEYVGESIKYNYVYDKGLKHHKENVFDRYPLEGASSLSNWPPVGWTNLVSLPDGQTGNAIENSTINFSAAKGSVINNSRTGFIALQKSETNVENIHLDSRFVLGFGSFTNSGSDPSSTDPNTDKILIDSKSTRSIARVAWKVGEK